MNRLVKLLILILGLLVMLNLVGYGQTFNNPVQFTKTVKFDTSVYFKRGAQTGYIWQCVNTSTGLGNWVDPSGLGTYPTPHPHFPCLSVSF